MTADQLPAARWRKGPSSYLRRSRALANDQSGHNNAVGPCGGCGLLSPWSLPLAGELAVAGARQANRRSQP